MPNSAAMRPNYREMVHRGNPGGQWARVGVHWGMYENLSYRTVENRTAFFYAQDYVISDWEGTFSRFHSSVLLLGNWCSHCTVTAALNCAVNDLGLQNYQQIWAKVKMHYLLLGRRRRQVRLTFRPAGRPAAWSCRQVLGLLEFCFSNLFSEEISSGKARDLLAKKCLWFSDSLCDWVSGGVFSTFFILFSRIFLVQSVCIKLPSMPSLHKRSALQKVHVIFRQACRVVGRSGWPARPAAWSPTHLRLETWSQAAKLLLDSINIFTPATAQRKGPKMEARIAIQSSGTEE